MAAAVAGGAPVYGVNTGFGKLASVTIPAGDTATLQRNLILVALLRRRRRRRRAPSSG